MCVLLACLFARSAAVWDESHRREMSFLLKPVADDAPVSVACQVWNHNPFDDDLVGSFEVGVENVGEEPALQQRLREPTWCVQQTARSLGDRARHCCECSRLPRPCSLPAVPDSDPSLPALASATYCCCVPGILWIQVAQWSAAQSIRQGSNGLAAGRCFGANQLNNT